MSTPERDNLAMNPQIVRDFEVGTRDLRQLTIYPLSMGDQVELEGILTNVLTSWYTQNPDGGDTVIFMTYILNALKDNMLRVLEFVTDISKEELAEVGKSFSNMQTSELVKVVYEVNYLDPYEKNLKSLPLMDQLSQLGRLAPSSSDDIPNTELKISTESTLKTEESQPDNSDSSSKKPTRTKRDG